jgi:hypothetical protein
MIPFFAIYAFIGVVVFFCVPRGVRRRWWTGVWLVLFAFLLYGIGILTGETGPNIIPFGVDRTLYIFKANMISVAVGLILGGGPALLLVFCARGVRRLAHLAMGKGKQQMTSEKARA